jgi:acyl-CoA reductase-like NAD-dependent aldehyde dehydrogenase
MESFTLLVDGRAVTTADHDPVINPATGEPFAHAPRATSAHVDEAMAAAARAFTTWRKDEALRRAKLTECAAALKARANAIGEVLSKEQGKPLKKAVGEVLAASAWLTYFAALKVESETLVDDAKKHVTVVRKPLGVVAAITPWNFPVALLAWKLSPALLAGNTVVAKPSPYTPLSSLLFAEALREILPAGVLSVLSGGNDLGAEIVAHPTVRKVSFTGSVPTGKKIMAAVAPDLKRVTLELGGNDPAIVLDDVDPKKVVEDLFWGAFSNSGQVCTAIKRLYVHEKVYAPIVEGLAARAKATKVGDGMAPETELGPINNDMQLTKLVALVDDAKKHGAHVEAGGERLARAGYFYPPTVVTGAREGMRLVDEEQFGTALPVMPFAKLDDAIERANKTHFGLGGSVWTSDVARGEAIVQELESGTGWVNQHLDIAPFTPFGGAKWSGIGLENGRWGYDEFTSVMTVNARR